MNQHHEAIAAFQQGRTEEALRMLEALLSQEETAELWNDWGAVQLGTGRIAKAEQGFSRALELDPQHVDASTNLGLLLLSRGNRALAKTLLEGALPSLPEEQRHIVRRLLRESDETIEAPAILNILVVSDTFQELCGRSDGLGVGNLLRTLRTLGHEVTFIARESANRAAHEQILRESGIRIYTDDQERTVLLGVVLSETSGWSLRGILSATKFDVAILIQDFGRGISVPEQYLDDIRRFSRETRIAVISEDVQDPERQQLDEQERERDYQARRAEAWERADLMMSPRNFAENPGAMLARIADISPKVAEDEPFSILRIEKVFAERLAVRSGEKRVLGQLECYVALAEILLRERKPEQAREQLRHILGRGPEAQKHGPFLSQVFTLLKRCYRELGDGEMAERCGAEARRNAMASGDAVSAEAGRRCARGNAAPAISLIVPTYNRLPILKKCLAALEAQTVPASDFEVIVVDDGSLDGTEAELRSYQPSFRLQYLRQPNSGTGAARRNGVAHATGEYLLLMNDDTICDPNLIEQHMRTQRAYPGERWAVLGGFEYPAEARRRALTRYFTLEPFMFPQVSMEEGCPYGYSHFITCNLSVRRDAVLEAGSFDSIYKLSEDTELGLRLFERGYRVLYQPGAHAWHDHLPYSVGNLMQRARIYGADYFHMFRRHPRVMTEWAMPVSLTGMDAENAVRIMGYVEGQRKEVEEAVEALRRWDNVDFEPILNDQPGTASLVLRLFRQAVPAIHWFYLFESMLHTMDQELKLGRLGAERVVMAAGAPGV